MSSSVISKTANAPLVSSGIKSTRNKNSLCKEQSGLSQGTKWALHPWLEKTPSVGSSRILFSN